jgi:hypothetical protein
VLRGIWFKRNEFVFKKQAWLDVKLILRKILRLTLEWKVIYKESKMEEMVIFFGKTDPTAIEDRKKMELSMKGIPRWVAEVKGDDQMLERAW